MMYLYVKSVHIIFVVSWFAGLFYLPRLFIYHTESQSKGENIAAAMAAQFALMEKKLWTIIITPAMVLTLATGLTMIWLNPALLHQDWMQVKLGFVIGLLVYHYLTYRIYSQLQHQVFQWTSMRLRIWNEIATIFLVAIVFIVVLKNAVDWIWGLTGLIVFSFLIFLAVRLYKRIRDKQPARG